MEDENKIYCIYAHINKVNGKIYIGQTRKNPPSRRWGNNGDGYFRHPHFYNAIQKYGWDNFDHEIIANGLTKNEADNFEKLLIEKLDTMNPSVGYNLKEGGHYGKLSEQAKINMSNAQKGKRMPEEAKQKIRLANIGKHHTEEAKRKVSVANKGRHLGAKSPTAKRLVQKDRQGNVIKTWGCMSEASRELNIEIANISACCHGRLNSAGGFIWEHEKEEE